MRHLLLAASLCASCCAQETLRMNQIQFIGTHNSYHAGLAPAVMAILRKQNPQAAASLNYKHPKLEAQLDAGVRQLELDVYGDAKGGLFADPLFLRLAAKEGPVDPMPPGWAEAMKRPGFKVMHANDVDIRSHCATFVACLQLIRTWSKAHPGHLPIYLQIENKESRAREGFTTTEPVTKATMDALDVEIRSVFQENEVVKPDDVRGKHTTLEEAVLQEGWPSLDWARNKVVFVLDQEKVTTFYTDGHPSLEGRKFNDATSPQIRELVQKGYLVRTMTDDPQSVLSGDTKRQQLGIASGAQILSIDYPFDWKAESGYHTSLPKDKVRCNPVNAPKLCVVNSPY